MARPARKQHTSRLSLARRRRPAKTAFFSASVRTCLQGINFADWGDAFRVRRLLGPRHRVLREASCRQRQRGESPITAHIATMQASRAAPHQSRRSSHRFHPRPWTRRPRSSANNNGFGLTGLGALSLARSIYAAHTSRAALPALLQWKRACRRRHARCACCSGPNKCLRGTSAGSSSCAATELNQGRQGTAAPCLAHPIRLGSRKNRRLPPRFAPASRRQKKDKTSSVRFIESPMTTEPPKRGLRGNDGRLCAAL